MLAAALAQAHWECARHDEALSLLAGRLDTLQRFGLPDTLMAAYRTLARIAETEKRQAQALSLLDTLRALGRARGQLRVQVLAQAELVRLHARHGRAETASTLSAELGALLRGRRTGTPALFQPWLDLQTEIARAQALLAHDGTARLPEVLQAAEAATALAQALKRDADLVEARLLRAEALRRDGSAEARAVFDEALSLAEAEGQLRVLRDQGRDAMAAPEPPAPSPQAETQASAAPPPNSLLTGKEREVLLLLERNLSNKEIALALAVSEQTVKWHVKNLFQKLNAGSRKHAVARARLLGLLPRA
jgi:LuxR family maltose regulon positive regulatory protein